MGNHLRELIDHAMESKVGVTDDRFRAGVCHDAIKQSLIRAENSICFHFGDIETLDGMKAIPVLFRLPYQNLWLEVSQKRDGVIFGALFHEIAAEEKVLVVIFMKKDGIWAIANVGYAESHQQGIELLWGTSSETVCKASTGIFDAFWVGISALNCRNVRKVESIPPEKVQKKRQKNGKKPLFSYWTLELKQERVEGEPQGGTHASPRLHLRRGHAREFAPGKYTWVQPCVVGNKALGMVHKDYALAQ